MDSNTPTEHLEAIKRHNETLERIFLGAAIPSTDDRLKGAIIEALYYLDNNSPPKAHEVLKRALSIK